MNVFKAVISTSVDYEQGLNDEHAEYGADKAVLVARLKAACEKLAPLRAWHVLVDQQYGFAATITVGETSHEAYVHDVELVC